MHEILSHPHIPEPPPPSMPDIGPPPCGDPHIPEIPCIPDPTGISLLLFAILAISEGGRAVVSGKSIGS